MAALKKYCLWFMSAALVFAAIELVRQQIALSALQESLNTEEAKLSALTAGKQDLASKLQAAQAKLKELDAAIGGLAAARGSATATGEGATRKVKTLAAVTKDWLAMANDPEVTNRLQARFRNQASTRYAGLISMLGLDDAKSQQLITLLVDKKMAATDVAVAAVQAGGGDNVDPATVAGSVVAAKATIESQIQALLGPDGYNDYRSYEIQAGQSGVVADVQSALASTSSPLTDQQVAMLQQVLQANNIGHVSDKVVSQSQAFLTPDQVQALQNLELRESKNQLQHVPQ